MLREWLEMFASVFEFVFISCDENEQTLVGGGNVEAEFEGGEIRDCGTFVFAAVFFGNGIERTREIPAKDVLGAASASCQAFFAIGGEDTKGGVLESSAEMTADNFLSFFAFVGVDANADKVTAGFNYIFLGVLTVRRLGVAGSEDSGDAATLRSGSHEENWALGALGFSKTVFEDGIPDES